MYIHIHSYHQSRKWKLSINQVQSNSFSGSLRDINNGTPFDHLRRDTPTQHIYETHHSQYPIKPDSCAASLQPIESCKNRTRRSEMTGNTGMRSKIRTHALLPSWPLCTSGGRFAAVLLDNKDLEPA